MRICFRKRKEGERKGRKRREEERGKEGGKTKPRLCFFITLNDGHLLKTDEDLDN